MWRVTNVNARFFSLGISTLSLMSFLFLTHWFLALLALKSLSVIDFVVVASTCDCLFVFTCTPIFVPRKRRNPYKCLGVLSFVAAVIVLVGIKYDGGEFQVKVDIEGSILSVVASRILYGICVNVYKRSLLD